MEELVITVLGNVEGGDMRGVSRKEVDPPSRSVIVQGKARANARIGQRRSRRMAIGSPINQSTTKRFAFDRHRIMS